jgi:GNAT superfamily N-acetyltransferase
VTDTETTTPPVVVQRARWPEIAPYSRLAAKEHVNVTETSDPTVWFKTSDRKGRVTGFAGIAPVSRTKARIRAVWVRPDFRGLGLGDALSQACLDYGLAAKFEKIEILSWDKRWAVRVGFADLGTTQHGASRMVYTVTGPDPAV